MSDRLRGRKAVAQRLRRLHNEPLCRHCLAKDIIQAADEIDHIIPLDQGGEDIDSNTQALCSEHHKIKTAKDMGYRKRATIGLDGFPVEDA